MSRIQTTGRLLAALAALVVGAGATGCGGSDDGEASSGKSDAAEVRALYFRIAEGFEERDPAKVCAGLTRRAREATARADSRSATCEDWVGRVVKDLTKPRPPKLVNIKVNDDRASAIASANGQRYAIPFVRTADGWRSDQPLSAGR